MTNPDNDHFGTKVMDAWTNLAHQPTIEGLCCQWTVNIVYSTMRKLHNMHPVILCNSEFDANPGHCNLCIDTHMPSVNYAYTFVIQFLKESCLSPGCTIDIHAETQYIYTR
jgi:hypothetical protein